MAGKLSRLICLASSAEGGHVGDILLTLRDATLVARVVLATDQAVGRAATLGLRVDVNLRAANILLDVAPEPFGSSERPALLRWIGEKPRELGAMRAPAADAARPGPDSTRPATK
jgi:hypothetical protein